MDLSAKWAGIETVAFCEIEPFCQKVLRKNFGKDIIIYDDVRTLTTESLQSRGIKHVDIVCGGDPCQENSGARIRQHSAHPSLGGEFIRIVNECRPKIVLRENPTKTRADAPWPWHRFRAELERLGYAVLPVRLRACCVGADHRRDRLFLLATLPDADGKPFRWPRQAEAFTPTGEMQTEIRQQRIRLNARPVLPVEQRRDDAETCGADDGLSRRVDRLRALGNSVMPQQVFPIFETIAHHNQF